MFALRKLVKPSACVLKESGALCSAVKAWTCSSVQSGHAARCVTGILAVQPPVRHYARAVKKVQAPKSQLSDLDPAMLKLDYHAVPVAQTADDLVKRLLTLELASHGEKLKLKQEQMIAKVQRDKNDRKSEEVRVAIMTARIRNLQDHLQLHRKDKANKRHMLMTIDKRKKLLKKMRMVRFDAFEKVCEQLGITYTFPPEYHRRITRRMVVKKAFRAKLYQEIKKRRAEEEEEQLQKKKKRARFSASTEADKTD